MREDREDRERTERERGESERREGRGGRGVREERGAACMCGNGSALQTFFQDSPSDRFDLIFVFDIIKKFIKYLIFFFFFQTEKK